MGLEYEFPVILGRDYAGVVEQVGPGHPLRRRRRGVRLPPARQSGRPRGKLGGADRRPAGHVHRPGSSRRRPRHRRRGAARRHRRDHGDRRARAVRRRHGADRRCDRRRRQLRRQLAAGAGATVVAPALPEDETYLRELGVSELLPRDGDLAARRRASATSTASTRCSTWSTTDRTSPRLSPRKAAVSLRPPEPRAKVPGGR